MRIARSSLHLISAPEVAPLDVPCYPLGLRPFLVLCVYRQISVKARPPEPHLHLIGWGSLVYQGLRGPRPGLLVSSHAAYWGHGSRVLLSDRSQLHLTLSDLSGVLHRVVERADGQFTLASSYLTGFIGDWRDVS